VGQCLRVPVDRGGQGQGQDAQGQELALPPHGEYRLGLRISIDDFGTGYSSLGYLKSFAIDSLKIDRRFLGTVGSGGPDDAIVRAIIGLGHGLGLVIVAEGVERSEQLAALRALGCDLVQGFLIGPALSPDEVVKRMAESEHRGGTG